MKKIAFLLFVLLILLNKSYSKDINGTIILKNDSFINVTFRIPTDIISGEINLFKIQKGLHYYSSDRLLKRLKLKQIKEIKFVFDLIEYRFISVIIKTPPPFVTKKHLLLLLKTDGKMRYFQHYLDSYASLNDDNLGYHVIRALKGKTNVLYYFNVIQINNNDLIVPYWFNDFKSICKYIEDCSSLVKKINDGIYSEKDIDKIVIEYNHCNE